MTLTDESPMPFGRYKDVKMQDVPAEHLLTWFENNKKDYWQTNGSVNYILVHDYISANLDTIKQQVATNNKFKKSI